MENLPAQEPKDAPLAFRMGGDIYTLKASHVLAVMEMQGVFPKPGTIAFLQGLVKVDDRLIPVIDLRPKLRCPPFEKTEKTRIVIVHSSDVTVGLSVDEVISSAHIRELKLEQAQFCSVQVGSSVKVEKVSPGKTEPSTVFSPETLRVLQRFVLRDEDE